MLEEIALEFRHGQLLEPLALDSATFATSSRSSLMHFRMILPNIRLPMGDISFAISDRASVRTSSVRRVQSPSG